MPRQYELEVKGRGIVPDSSHLTQKMAEVTRPPYREGNLPGKMLGATTNRELRGQILKYSLTATDPWALIKER